MKLSKRLDAIAQLIKPNSVVADIGTDHALLPCYLVNEVNVKHVYACDINQGPLDHAAQTVQKYGCDTSISLVLSPGLAKLSDNLDTIVIAGMGFETIKIILENDIARFTNLSQLIIQSNTDLYELRQWLINNGFSIKQEVLVDDGFYYHILEVVKGNQELDELSLRYGVNIQAKDVWHAELLARYNHLTGIISKLPTEHPQAKNLQHEVALLTTLMHQIA